MKLRMTSQEQFILNNIIEIIKNLKKRQEEKSIYSSAIEFAISELVRGELRIIARESEWVVEKENLLHKALKLTKQKVLEKLEKCGISFDITNYFENVEKSLEYPAREVSELRKQLMRSKELERFGKKTSSSSETGVSFEITELGLRDSIEGLLACPLAETYEIDPEKIKESYEVEGDWFPFHVNIDDFTFIVDDDGTIFVSTENFPKDLISRANEILRRLANQLYRKVSD
jgi:hypothetical protein